MITKRRKYKAKKNRRGNHRRAQFLYVMINLPLVWLVKIGITTNVANRKRNISESIFGIAFPVVVFYLYDAHGFEQFLHRMLKPFHIPFHGSGKTEWFFVLALVLAIPLLILRQLIDFIVVVLIFAVIVAAFAYCGNTFL